ncbi:hypothetical protein HU200_015593 [Digitaria exilis]|uniref:Flavin-containing monooxygenase n=1 Tax=Digitaria exilis TaxID=1010633 RepID=A0A835KIJ7_9POAL|nr:hypothetical protein HU200_015593 [Digitaria exilis]
MAGDDARGGSLRLNLRSRKVCVIGAGMAALAAARELRCEGHAVTVMEQRGDVGGQWLYDPRTDAGDRLGAAPPPVKVHSSMYASVRLISPRELMGFSDFQFLPTRHGGGDPRRFPVHGEVYRYLKDFCDTFGLMDFVKLNTRVVRVAMAPPRPPDEEKEGGDELRWVVRSVKIRESEDGITDDKVIAEEEEEVFDAVVVANGHYSQPRLPSINGMEQWKRRQLHSHSYRVPDPFRGEVVVLVGCGDSGLDIALDLCGVAREVHLTSNSSMASATSTTPAMAKMLANHAGHLHLHPRIDRLCHDGHVAFTNGSIVVADTVIYCTGYDYSFPFLDTGGLLTVDDNRVGPLFEHVFPPAMAPSLSFVGVPKKVIVPWFFQAQARVEEMVRAVEEYHHGRENAGVHKKYSHDIGGVDPSEAYEFVAKYTDLPAMDDWKRELISSVLRNINEDREAFLDRDDDSENVRQGVERWLAMSAAEEEDAAANATSAGVDDSTSCLNSAL